MPGTPSRLDELYTRLVVNDSRSYIPSLRPIDYPFTDEECGLLLLNATTSALVAGSSRDEAIAGRRAYDIATRLPKFANGNRRAIALASDYILSRLGNFPARGLARSGGLTTAGVAEINPFIALEILARETDNALGDGRTLLTDFQVKLLSSLREFQSVSFSAPTSAGKSTALEFEIVRRLRSQRGCVTVLVPTRALIRQVTFDLIALLNREGLNDTPVVSAPDPNQIQNVPSVVCIFTQERLQTLLTNDEWKGSISTLIVDEAQEIGEGSRGQTLELTILQVLARYPQCSIFFSSPLRSNPEYLLATVDRTNNSAFFVEHSSPVTQNLFLIRPVDRKPRSSTVSVWFDGEERPLGRLDLSFDFRGSTYIADFAVVLTKTDDTSIIYAGEAKKAEDLASKAADQLPESRIPAADELTAFVRDQIHPAYVLADVVTKGVAFHYGKLPQILRAKVEDLLRDRHLRIVCCTSTLLQGVNLPAKNIFIDNPMRGRGQPMTVSDFWNLAGRAGRLAQEFQGNIFCLYGRPWQTNPLTESRFFPLESAFQTATSRDVSTLLQVAQHPPESSESDLQWAEQAIARVFVQFTERGDAIASSRFATPETQKVLEAIDNECKKFAIQKTLPATLYQRNPYFLPQRLDKLADFFRSQTDLSAWIPPNPFVRQNYFRYEPIFKAIEDLFLRQSYDRHKYFTVLALQWMTGESLKQLIKNRLEFKKVLENDASKISTEIRGLFEDIEDELRYTYVKYFKVYADVLRAVLSEKGLADLQERIPPIHLYLEYGAANVTLISLMSLGLSRTSALLFKSHYGLRDDVGTADCQQRIDRADIRSTDLPALCKTELARLRRH